MSEAELVRLEQGEGGVAVLTLSNPAMRNAITRELSAQMNRVLARVAGDRAVRALVVTGEGEESFCAGMSLRDFLELRRIRGSSTRRARACSTGGGRFASCRRRRSPR
jgi:enoyl-CoA hydratase/carnithine racemase